MKRSWTGNVGNRDRVADGEGGILTFGVNIKLKNAVIF